MRISMLLAFVVALSLGSIPNVDADATPASAVGASLQSAGSHGVLNIVGAEGMPFDAFTSSGNQIAGGVLSSPNHSESVSGLAGPEAGVVVVIGGAVLAVADEEWSWY